MMLLFAFQVECICYNNYKEHNDVNIPVMVITSAFVGLERK